MIRRACVVVLLFAAFATSVQRGEAHKPITSKYTYNDDVFPVLRERCARCHVAGGVAPMSLMTYEEAVPWAESIRAELVTAHMPPAAADQGFGDVAHALALSPRDTDVLLTWATGGTPRGAIGQKVPASELNTDWVLGTPDLALPLPLEVSLAADAAEETREFVMPTGFTEPRSVHAVDLRPGNPAIVRSATVSLKGAPDHVLARWLPGQDPVRPDGAVAFRLPAGAELAVRIRYKKTWAYEGKEMRDRSTVGLYFAKTPDARELMPLTIVASPVSAEKGRTFSFTHRLDRSVEAFAIDTDQVPDDVALQVEAVRPDGSRAPLVRFVTRADWLRRYWLVKPVSLPAGAHIEVSGVVEDANLAAAAFGGPPPAQRSAASPMLKLALDVVAIDRKPSIP